MTRIRALRSGPKVKRVAVVLGSTLWMALVPGVGHAATTAGKACQTVGTVTTCEWITQEFNQPTAIGPKDLEEEWASISDTSGRSIYIIIDELVFVGPTGAQSVIEQTGCPSGAGKDPEGDCYSAQGTGSLTVHGYYADCDGNDASNVHFRFYVPAVKGWVEQWDRSHVVSDSTVGRCNPGGGKDGP